MTTPRADDSRPRSAAPASEGLHSLAAVAQTGAASALEIAYHYTPEYKTALEMFRLQRKGHFVESDEMISVLKPLIDRAHRDETKVKSSITTEKESTSK